VDESPERVRRNHAEEPEDKQHYENCPKHIVPISQGPMSSALVPHLESAFVIFQMTDTRRLVAGRLSTCAHISEYLATDASAQNWQAPFLISCDLPSLLGEPLRPHPIDFSGTDDKAIGRRANIVKREARDECQIVAS
jgi:hypothetical protein